MSDPHPLNEGERKSLYISLLRGLANECQDRLCAADGQHAWGPWERYIVEKDGPKPWQKVIDLNATAMTCDETYQVASRGVCLNCGKERFSR